MRVSVHKCEDSAVAQHAVPALGADEVQVWLAKAPTDEASLAGLDALLSPEERARAQRFRASEPRCEFVLGRARLRQLLGACLQVNPTAVAFGYEPHGKPFLTGSASDTDLRFSLSHSHSMVAIALTRGRAIGIDLESMQWVTDWPLLVKRIFSPRERGELHALPEPQQREAFFNGWTRKEAYLKATGEGLIDNLPAIEVTLAPGREPELLGLPAGAGAASQWAIRAVPLPPDLVGAVVFEKIPATRRKFS